MQILNAKQSRPKDGVFIGRPSVLGNPFIMYNESDRDTVISKFKTYLIERIVQNDMSIITALRQLNEDSKLVCFCSPSDCHGRVIEEVWNELKLYGLETFQTKYSNYF